MSQFKTLVSMLSHISHSRAPMAFRQAPIHFRVRHSSTHVTHPRVPLAYELHRPHAGRRPSPLLSKHPIVILHGFLGSKRENRRMAKFLAQDLSRQVFCLDLRNHGESGHHPKHDYLEMALDVELFLRTHQLDSPIVIGHSMGAKTALTLALNSPDAVSGVVAIDNCPIHLPLTEEFPRYLEAMVDVDNAQVKTHLEADHVLSKYEPSSPVRLWLLSNFAQERHSQCLRSRVPLDILQTAFGPLGDFPLKGQPVQFQKPALFLRALKSHYIPQDALATISSFFPASSIVDIDCGHWIVQERPKECRQAMVQFVQNHIAVWKSNYDH